MVAGRFGGLRLKAPRGAAVRPTSDRVREALFSVLGEALDDARVLDLFAGSGALGVEALSRGAAHATFVDSSPAALRAVRDNLAAAGVAGQADVHRGDARAFLRNARRAGRQYDLVFIDPPDRRTSVLAPALSELLPAVLAAGARVVSESDRRAPLELALERLDERRYGDTLIRIHGT